LGVLWINIITITIMMVVDIEQNPNKIQPIIYAISQQLISNQESIGMTATRIGPIMTAAASKPAGRIRRPPTIATPIAATSDPVIAANPIAAPPIFLSSCLKIYGFSWIAEAFICSGALCTITNPCGRIPASYKFLMR